MIRLTLCWLTMLISAIVACYASGEDLPLTKVNSLKITAIDGPPWSLADKSQSNIRASVFIFVNTTCPIANAYQPRLRELAKEFESQGIRFVQIHADPKLQADDARKHAKEFDIRCAVALDPDQQIAKALGAKVTPEAIVVDHRGDIRYRGRIDDQFAGYGKKRPAPTQEELHQALSELCAGKPITITETKAVGCVIHYATRL
jgi:thiol-disulfide isomerase/thioredoxin